MCFADLQMRSILILVFTVGIFVHPNLLFLH